MLPVNDVTWGPLGIDIWVCILSYKDVAEALLQGIIVTGEVFQFVQPFQVKGQTAFTAKIFHP
jgi:hypothetical protein